MLAKNNVRITAETILFTILFSPRYKWFNPEDSIYGEIFYSRLARARALNFVDIAEPKTKLTQFSVRNAERK